ncbi:hypothetical protein J7M07_00130 [bacterium]|nr:hypothetical protein [bacterium]
MRYNILIILFLTAVSLFQSTLCEGAKVESCENLIVKAGDSYLEEEPDPDGQWDLEVELEKNCRRLDSLLSLYTPIDTLTGWIGMPRILGIAESYTNLEMYDIANRWWKLLRRVDRKGYFRIEEYSGLLRTGTEISDTELISNLMGKVEMWDASVKKALGEELLMALDYLLVRDVDPEWLYTRYNRLKRFLPEIDSDFFYFSLLSRQGKREEAYNLVTSLINSLGIDELTPERAFILLKDYIRASILSGRFKEAESILKSAGMYGNDQIARQAKLLLPRVQLLNGRIKEAGETYQQLCSEEQSLESECFWAGFFKRYEEIVENVR